MNERTSEIFDVFVDEVMWGTVSFSLSDFILTQPPHCHRYAPTHRLGLPERPEPLPSPLPLPHFKSPTVQRPSNFQPVPDSNLATDFGVFARNIYLVSGESLENLFRDHDPFFVNCFHQIITDLCRSHRRYRVRRSRRCVFHAKLCYHY
jgi:hypothetical protein